MCGIKKQSKNKSFCAWSNYSWCFLNGKRRFLFLRLKLLLFFFVFVKRLIRFLLEAWRLDWLKMFCMWNEFWIEFEIFWVNIFVSFILIRVVICQWHKVTPQPMATASPIKRISFCSKKNFNTKKIFLMNSVFTASLFHKLLMVSNFNAVKNFRKITKQMVTLTSVITARKNWKP